MNKTLSYLLLSGLVPLHAQNLLDPLVVTAERSTSAIS